MIVRHRFLSALFFSTFGWATLGSGQAPGLEIMPTVEFLELNECSVGDAARMLTSLTGVTVVATEMARTKMADAIIEDLSLDAVLKVICRSSSLVYRYDASSKLYTILALEEYQRTALEETQGTTQMRTFKVGTANLNQMASAIMQLFGSRVVISGGEPIEDFREQPGMQGFNASVSRTARIYNGGVGRTGITTSNNTRNQVFYGGGYGAYGGGYGGGMGGYGNYGGGYGGYGGGYGNYGGGFGGYGGYPNGGYGGGYGNNSPYGYGGSYGNLNERFGMRNPGGSGVGAFNEPLQSRLNSESALEIESARSAADQPLDPDQRNSNTAIQERLRRSQSSMPLIYVSTSYEHSYLMVRTADKEAMVEIEKLIEQLDEVVPQVILEMKILQLDVGDSFNGGVSINLTNGNEQFTPATRDPATGTTTGQNFAGFENSLGFGNFVSEAASTFAYQYISDKVNARVDLMASDNRVEVIATPLLIATNNRSAQIEVGEERIITVGASTETTTNQTTNTQQEFIRMETEKRTIGVVLDILPRINDDGTVTLSVFQESTTLKPRNNTIQVGANTVAIDSVDTANVDATVVAKNNCTIAVGGLIRTENGNGNSKVPVLGDIPLLGLAFKKKNKTAKKTEIILLITPHILLGKGQDSDETRKLMEKLSDHRFHRGGEAIVDGEIPQLQKYRQEGPNPYPPEQLSAEEKTRYWEQLGASAPSASPYQPYYQQPSGKAPAAAPVQAEPMPEKKKRSLNPFKMFSR